MKANDLDTLVVKREEVIKAKIAHDAAEQLHDRAIRNLKDFENSIKKKHKSKVPQHYIHKGKIVTISGEKIEIKDPDELDQS